MPELELKKAIWTPSWFELDQSIAVGLQNKFWFFTRQADVTEGLADVDFTFYNQHDSDAPSELRFATVAKISHPVLGPLSKVDTDGLDYIFAPIGGDDVVVNAEEEPGNAYVDDLHIDDWTVFVVLAHVSDPIADVV